MIGKGKEEKVMIRGEGRKSERKTEESGRES